MTISDLAAVSGVLRAFEIFDETLDGEVQIELESFAGNKISKREAFGLNQIRNHRRYIILAPLHMWDLYCFAGYEMRTSDGYPTIKVYLEASPGTAGRDVSVAAMRQVALRSDWNGWRLDEPMRWATVVRERSLASLLHEEDHVAAVKRFFIESIHQLREELTEFKKENPDLPWNGGNPG